MEENKPTGNEKWKGRARPAIYAMAGIYLVFQAYYMFKAISTTAGGEQMLMIAFTIIFAIIGLAMVVLGLRAGYRVNKEMHEEHDKDIE